jgi:Deoxyribodipyrimidine photolyase
MEIIWLKRDVRLNDHGPFAQVAKSNRPLIILYNYEPDQLVEHSVHGSHVAFVNEGLIDLDRRLSSRSKKGGWCDTASSRSSKESRTATFRPS